MSNALPKRPNVCMLVVNQQGKLFLGQRLRAQNVWQFPQGGVEPDATLEENVLRELNEEIGVEESSLKIVKKLKATNEYEFQAPPEYAKGRWSGQSQNFFIVEFLGDDSEIKLDTHEPEFSTYRWCDPDEVRKLAEPIRLKGYEAALKEFEEFIQSRS